jgi:hypothetical protein
MAQTYQINYDARTQTSEAFATLNDVAQNAFHGYGLQVTQLQYVAAQGRVRVTLNNPLPQEEVDSFGGTITAL